MSTSAGNKVDEAVLHYMKQFSSDVKTPGILEIIERAYRDGILAALEWNKDWTAFGHPCPVCDPDSKRGGVVFVVDVDVGCHYACTHCGETWSEDDHPFKDPE